MYVNAKGRALHESGATVNTIADGLANSIRKGTIKNDLMSGLIGDTMNGGRGDDTYYLWSATSKIGELAGEGIDTAIVRYWGAATLADNVENLVLASGGATSGTGNALDNIITAGTIGATLNGLSGNDVLVGGSGADLFRVQVENGSDTIVAFESGRDSIQLQGYGFSSFEQIMAAASQVGSDTRIALGNGEVLVLNRTDEGKLVAADFGFQSTYLQSAAAGVSTMFHGGQANTFNGWTAFNNVWGAGALKEGTDFTIGSTYSRADMTAGTTFIWSFPYVTDAFSTVRAYPEVMFGVNPKGNYASNPTDTAHTFPIALDKLHALDAKYDVAITGSTSGFNVAFDVWLTSKPNGDRSTITNEVMIWVHQGDVQPFGKLVGTYVDGDFTAKIYHNGTYTAVIADGDHLSGTLDIAGVIAKLQDLGIVTGQQYVASVELGAEVVSGVGSLTINKLDLTVESLDDKGALVVTSVTGAGSTVTQAPAFTLDYTAGTVAELNHYGAQVGSKVTTIDVTGVTIQHLDLQSRLVSTDVLTAGSTGGVTTKHYDAAQRLTGSDTLFAGGNGSEVIRHYDASGQLVSSDTMLTDAQGRDWTYHYDAAGKLTIAEKVIHESATTTTTQFVDPTGKIIGADKVVVAGNATSVQHFDAAFALTGAEKVTLNADGSTTTQHYAGNWALTGVDIARPGATGVVTETHYDAKYQVTGTLFTGTVGADTIAGTSGSNTYHAGFGADTLKLGAGVDLVYFDSPIGSDVDRLTGFNAARDTIFLDHADFAGTHAGTLSADAFVLGTTAKDANDLLIYDKATGSVWFDADGSGAHQAVLFAQVDPGTALTAADFIVV